MSLLEDVFLEDEAGEAQELERIIEGDEYDEQPRQDSNSDDNSEKEDEAQEDKRRVDPPSNKTKRVIKNPRFVLNPARLTGPRGIQVIPEHFKDFKFKGKGHEIEDLDLVLKKLEHWAYRLYPKFKFEDCLKKIETLGKKRPVMVHLHKIRSDQLVTEDVVVQNESSDEETPVQQEEDEFDKLLQQQIELARTTPAPGSVRKAGFETPGSLDKRSPLLMPKATSSPSISDEQKERMMRNRKLAEERRLARLKANTTNSAQNQATMDEINRNGSIVNDDITNESHNITSDTQAKKQRFNVIDSSDEENEVSIVKESVNVDIHINGKNDDTESVDVEDVLRKKNKSNVIDSSDDENDHHDNIETVIDITEGYQSKNTQKHDNKNNEEIVIDITEGYQSKNISTTNNDVIVLPTDNNHEEINKKQHNRSNVIDSSDEECDITTVNEAVVVDIHDDTFGRNDANIDVAMENANIDHNIHNVDVTDKETIIDIQTSEIHDDHDIDSLPAENLDKNSSNRKSLDTIEENSNVQLKSPKESSKAKVDKENIDINCKDIEVVDELMDVDFSEDF